MLDQIIQFFQNYGTVVVFIATLLDSIPFFALLVPEEVIFALITYLGDYPLYSILLIWFAASTGMLIGQAIMYTLGRLIGEKVFKVFKLTSEQISKVKLILAKKNLILNLLIRFSSTYRAIIGLLAGTTKLRIKSFILYEIIISTVKPVIFISIGYFFSGDRDSLTSFLADISFIILISASISIGISIHLANQNYSNNTNN